MAAISRTRSGYRSAVMPRTKNVAFAPSSSRRPRIAARLALERVAPLVPVRAAERAVDELVPVLEVEANRSLAISDPTLRSRALKRLAPTLLVAALLVATATAFAVTEQLKLEDSPVISTRIPRLFSPRLAEARIGFRLRREEDISSTSPTTQGTVVSEGSAPVSSARPSTSSPGTAATIRDGSFPDGIYRRPTDLEGRRTDDRVPEDDHGRLDAPDDRGDAEDPAQVFSPDGDGRVDRFDFVLPIRRARLGDPLRRREAGRPDVPDEAGRRVSRGTGEARSRASTGSRSPPRTARATSPLRRASSRCGFATSSSSSGGSRRKATTLRVRVSSDAKTLTWKLGNRTGSGQAAVAQDPRPSAAGALHADGLHERPPCASNRRGQRRR